MDRAACHNIAIAKARIELGLDKPLYVQYLIYTKDFLRGDWEHRFGAISLS